MPTACEAFDAKLAELEKLRSRTKGRKMDERLRTKFADLEKKVRDARLACTDERVYEVHKDQINKEIQDFVHQSVGGVRDGMVSAAVRFSSYAADKKPANAGFVLTVPDAAVNAVRAFFLESSPAAVIMERLTGGASNPVAKSLDANKDVQKMLNTLTANMGELSKLTFSSFNNFGVKLRTKHSKVWTAIAFDWTQGGRKPLTKDALARFYNATGIPLPNKKYGDEIFYAMASAFNQWKQQGEPARITTEDVENEDVTGDDLHLRITSAKDNINVKINEWVNDSIGDVRDGMQDAAQAFASWAGNRPEMPNAAGLVMDVLGVVAAVVGAAFPPAGIAMAVAGGILSIAKGPLTDGLDPKKDAAAMADQLKMNMIGASDQLNRDFAKFGERLFRDNRKVWDKIGLALTAAGGGLMKEAQEELYNGAGVPRPKQEYAKPLLKKLIMAYLKWERKTGSYAGKIADIIDPNIDDKQSTAAAEEALVKVQKTDKQKAKK